MKKFILLFLSVMGISTGAFAQMADFSNGYYRVTNVHSDRYIHVLDNKGSLNVQTSSADMGAIVLKKGIERSVSDPASVLYVEKHGSQYDIKAQNTGIYAMIGVYVNLMNSPQVPDAVWAYGKKGTMTMYLWDAKSNMDAVESYLDTRGSSRDWYVKPIDNSTDNYFGVMPTHQAGGKYYASMYAAFPFSTASSGMKVYYVTKVDAAKGVAVYKEITGTVPALTPVIIECSSDNPANNKLNIGGSGTAPSGNLGKGVLFDMHKYKHDNFVTYDRNTMRTIGLAPDGSLAMTAADYQDVPKNTFYISVNSSCPTSLKLIPESEYDAGPVAATSVTLDRTNLSLYPGETATISATVAPANTTDKTVTWTSSNPAVASVNANGQVTAVAPGSATITATCGPVNASCSVTVNPAPVVEPTGITLSQTSLNLETGASATLTATVTPANTTDKTVTWTSSNPAVASVNAYGRVTAVAPGSATITATCGPVSASCSVTVNPAPVVEPTGITLSQTSLNLETGASATLTATVTPSNATDKTVTWTSSNPAVASVNANGLVNALSAGSATITASCGSVSASCSVTVTNSTVAVTSVTLNLNSLSLYTGESQTLTATVAPDNATDKTVTWTSSNPAVASVNANGLVTAVAPGSATITATCGSVSASCSVTVANRVVEANLVILDYSYLSLFTGDTKTLTATVFPFNTTDKTVTWASSDPAVASVDSNGLVSALSAGSATITASCGNVSATCRINVTDPVVEAASVTLDITTLFLAPGESHTLNATVAPENTTDKTVTWTSSNTSVATVDANGTVTAVAAGSARITASCGAASASCAVTVDIVEASSIQLSASSLSINIGEEVVITATVLPENTTNKTVTWTSSNPAVASVDENGKIIGVALGTASITATCGIAKARCSVIVSPVKAESVTLNFTELSMIPGDTETLVATVLPEEVADKNVVWKSSDTSVARVNSSGVVTAVAPGTAVIKASVDDVEAECTVTVNAVEAVRIILNATSIEINVPDTYQLTATVVPDNTTDKTVTWTSSDTSKASVDANGLVTAIAEGNVRITATCGSVSTSCDVKVNPRDGISDIFVDGKAFDVYTLGGIKVRSQATSLEGLAPGFYIVNGQKIRL